MALKFGELGDTITFPFAVNDTSGSAIDGSGFTVAVYLVGSASSAAPVHAPTATLLSNAGFANGCYVISIQATAGNGYADNSEYIVFVQGTADGETPVSCLGSFQLGKLQTAADFGIHETTIATLSSQSSFTLTAGSDQDNAYNDFHMTITDADNTTRCDQVYMSDYTGSTKTATMGAVTTTFSAAVGDKVRIYSTKAPALLATASVLSGISGRIPSALNNGCIPADVQRVNDVDVDGAGSLLDPWGPA